MNNGWFWHVWRGNWEDPSWEVICELRAGGWVNNKKQSYRLPSFLCAELCSKTFHIIAHWLSQYNLSYYFLEPVSLNHYAAAFCVREQETFQKLQVRVAQKLHRSSGTDAQKAEKSAIVMKPQRQGRLMLRSLALLLQVLRMFVFKLEKWHIRFGVQRSVWLLCRLLNAGGKVVPRNPLGDHCCPQIRAGPEWEPWRWRQMDGFKYKWIVLYIVQLYVQNSNRFIW